MENLEMSGKTVEEATQQALKELGISREEAKVTVLKEGRHGVLGLGADEARVRIEPLMSVQENERDTTELVKSILETLLSKMGVSADVVPRDRPFVEKEGETTPITFDINGDDLGILIGRRGQTLSCLQYIVRLLVGYQTKVWMPIIIDVEGYKQRRYESLQALAWRIAEQVKMRHTPFTLEPMPAYERRVIHLTLSDHPDVTTESADEGEARKVIVSPRQE